MIKDRLISIATGTTLFVGLWILPFSISAQPPELVVQTGHLFQLFTVAYSPDGKLIASGGEDGTVVVWDGVTGRQLRSLFIGKNAREGVRSVAFSTDGKTIASANGARVMMLWDMATGKERQLEGISRSVVFSPDGELVSGGHNGPVLWDVATGKEINAFGTINSNEFPPPKINSVAISTDGRTIVTGSTDQTVKLWEKATGRIIRTLSHSGEVYSVAISPDGKLVASGAGGFIRLWDATTGAQLWRKSGLLTGTAFSADGRSMAVVIENSIRILDASSGSEIRTLSGTSGARVMTMTFSPDGKRLVSGHGAGEVKQWDVETGVELMALLPRSDAIHRLAISPNADRIALTGWNKNTIKVVDVAAGTMLTLLGHTRLIDSVWFSPNGRLIATGSSDDTIKLWDARTGHLVRTIPAANVNGIAFSPDSRSIAFFTEELTRDGIRAINHINLESGAELRKWEVRGVAASIAFSPDGRRIVTGNYNDIIFYDSSSGSESLRMSLGSNNSIRRVAFSPDGKTVATYDEYGNSATWDATTGAQLQAFGDDEPATQAKVFAAVPAIYPTVDQQGRIQLVVGGESGKVQLRQFGTRNVLATLIALNENDWLVTTPDGYFDGTPEAWRQLIWRFNNNTLDYAPIEAYFNDFFYPNLLQDVIARRLPKPRGGGGISRIDRRQPTVTLSSSAVAGDSRKVNIRIEVFDNANKVEQPGLAATGGARDVRLFRNGSLVKMWRGDVLNGKPSAVLESAIPVVAGENNLTAYAFNRENVKSADATLTVKGADTLKRKGVAYVLAVGINDYANAQYDLRYAVPDATDFASEVKRQQEKLGNFQRIEIVALHNKEATKANILGAIGNIATKIQPEDLLTIYFAGHGVSQQNRFYLMPHDLGYMGQRTKLDSEAVEVILKHSISDEELETAVEKIDASKLLMVIDACNSGQALEAEEKRRGPMNSKGLAQLAYEKGMFILAAAQSQQAALEVSRLGHGLLTFALLEGLVKAERNAGGEIIERKWLDYAVRTVPELQLDEMRKRSADINDDPAKRDSEIVFLTGDNKNLPPEKRGLQTPRVFYRRELEVFPLVIARP